MGRTGVASGTHLHFELIIGGVNVDPLLHLPPL
jgi:murein DD-endopeptidase MepM/ murein hydrolase activator NlpD